MTRMTQARKPLRSPRKPRSVKPAATARSAGSRPAAVNPLAAALQAFDQAAVNLGLDIDARLKLLNLGRSKYFELRSEAEPVLDVDRQDRLGYFLAIYELSGRLVGAPGDWLKAANRAPLFGGRPPLERLLKGHMEDLIATVSYLKGTYGGWA